MKQILMEDSKDSHTVLSQNTKNDNRISKEMANELYQGEYEINSHFRLRKECYLKAKKEGHDNERALIISNAFQNYYYMG